MNDLVKLTARQAVAELKRGAVSPLELIDAALERIDETGGDVNALPTICADKARDYAARLPDLDESDTPRGYLHGLPIAIKDLKDVAGVRSTRGSPIFSDHVPDKSDLLVTNLESRGGIVLAKSNTPEFGAGANTFNEVFGKTRNPWDTSKTCGGSSGGSTTALASGQIWLASGSDFGGSLRIPASFCSVVGLRPTPGRVAHGPSAVPVRNAVGRRAYGQERRGCRADAGRAGGRVSGRPFEHTRAKPLFRGLRGQSQASGKGRVLARFGHNPGGLGGRRDMAEARLTGSWTWAQK